MLKNIIVLPDGTEVSSGSNHVNAIQSVTLTQSVNNSEELTLGSACAAMLEAKLITPGGGLDIAAGTEVTLYKQDDSGTRHKMGLFTLEKPTRPTAGTMKLVGYDRVTKLDKDLTAWLAGLDGWPYRLIDFAAMVCEACELAMATANLLNGDMLVEKFTYGGVTGRQLLQWIGEIAGSFARATEDGEIELGTYRQTGISVTSVGDLHYFAGGLTYENYEVEQVEAVQLCMGDGEDSYLRPKVAEGTNSYVITGNPLLRITEDAEARLEALRAQIPYGYRPCKISMPASMELQPGDMFRVQDKNGAVFTSCVMTRTIKGQKMTLECTGSKRRDSTVAVNNKTLSQQTAQNRVYAQSQAKQAVAAQTPEEVFLKLTDGGKLHGIFKGEDGELYINASYLKTGIITGDSAYFDLDKGSFYSTGGGSKIEISNGDLKLYNSGGVLVADVTNDNGGTLRLYDKNGQSVSNNYYAYSTMEAVSTQLEKVESMMDLVDYAFGASTQDAYAHDAAIANYINPLNRWFFSAVLKDTWLKEVELYLQPISADAKVTVELWEKNGDTLQYSKSRSLSVPKTLTAGYHKVPVEAKLDGEWMVSVRPSGYNVCGIAAGQTCRYINDLESKTLSYSALSSFATGGFAGRLITAVYEAKTDVQAAPKTVLFVGPGQIYETIQDALDSITDDGTYTVLVYPQAAPYSRFSMIRRLDGAYPWTGSVARNVSVIALDPGHTVVRTDTNNYDAPPAELLCNGLIKGITFLSTYERQDSAATKPAYAAHIDSAPTGAYTMVLENCRFIAHAAPAVGIGVHQDGHLVFKDCQFHALGQTDYAPHEGYTGLVSGYGGVYVHTSTKAGVTGQHITFDNCRVVAPSHTYGIALLQAGSFNADDCEFTVTAHNTHIYAPAATKRCAISAGIILDPASFGNNSTNLNASEITA